MVKPIVGSMSEWSGMLKDLFRQIDDGSVSLANLRDFLEHRNPFDDSGLPDINPEKIYEALGMSAEYADFAKSQNVSANPSLWTVPALKGVTCNKVVSAMKKLGVKFYLYTDDLDKDVPTNDRDPSNGSYVVSFRRTIEADEENKNLSADQLKSSGHQGITLLERLLLELGYFLATGKHLDENNWTLCAGSRYGGGDVPGVDWSSGYREVRVRWVGPGSSYDGLRSRSAVS